MKGTLMSSPLHRTLAGVLLALLGTAAQADSGPRVAPLPKYTQECAACHIAYPRGCCRRRRGSA